LTLLLSVFSTFSGFDIGRVRVLCGDGTEKFSVGADTVSAEMATKKNLLSAITDMAAVADPKDAFLFLASNHGGPGPDGSKDVTLWCWKEEKLSASEFAEAVAAVRAVQQLYIFGQCYSGGFVDSLASKNRCIATACAFDEVSYANEDATLDEFLSQVATGFQKQLTTFHEVFNFAAAADTQPENPQLSDFGAIADRGDIFIPSIIPD